MQASISGITILWLNDVHHVSIWLDAVHSWLDKLCIMHQYGDSMTHNTKLTTSYFVQANSFFATLKFAVNTWKEEKKRWRKSRFAGFLYLGDAFVRSRRSYIGQGSVRIRRVGALKRVLLAELSSYNSLIGNTSIGAAILFSCHPYVGTHYRSSRTSWSLSLPRPLIAWCPVLLFSNNKNCNNKIIIIIIITIIHVWFRYNTKN